MWLTNKSLRLLVDYAKKSGIKLRQIHVLHPGEGRLECTVVTERGIPGVRADKIATLTIVNGRLKEVLVNQDKKE